MDCMQMYYLKLQLEQVPEYPPAEGSEEALLNEYLLYWLRFNKKIDKEVRYNEY